VTPTDLQQRHTLSAPVCAQDHQWSFLPVDRLSSAAYPAAMIFVWGRRFYGKIEQLDEACVRTFFFHLFFLPLVPYRSFLLVTGSGERALQLPLEGRSVLAGYARAWPLLTTYVGIALASETALVPGVLLAVVSGLLGLWAWLRLGRLSATGRLERKAYALFVGALLDVALIVQATRGQDRVKAEHWLADVTTRAEAVFAEQAENAHASYRDAARFSDWRQVAEQPQAASARCRSAALTLARIAWARSDDGAREQVAAAHTRLRAALGTDEPELARAA
jgi:hypothetical protein